MTAPARPQAPPVGLYSIGVRGLSVERLPRWTAGYRIPFVHLRGGPRGHDLAGWNRVRAERVRAVSQATVPITLVTANLDLIRLRRGATGAPAEARSALSRLAETAALIGAGAVRPLARERPDLAALDALDVPDAAVPVLIELHDPGWLRPTAMTALKRLLGRWRRSRLPLDIDTAQVQTAAGAGDRAILVHELEQAVAMADVLQISDPGWGLEGSGHRMAVEAAARALLGGARIEVAFEWTGADRSPAACLDRYRAPGACWGSVWTSALEGRAGRAASPPGAPVGTRP